MAEFGNNLKNIWMKGMEAIGNTASSIASNTRFKVDEMNMVNRRAEILKDFGAKAYELWQKGAHFPEELEEQLQELGKLDEKLNDLRAERFAGVQVKEKEEAPAKEAAEETAETAGEAVSDIEDTAEDAAEAVTEEIEEAAATVTEAAEEIAETFDDPAEEAKESIPVIRVETPAETRQSGPTLSETINSLFEKVPSADEAVEKVNSALDSLESGLKQFSDGLDEKIDDLTKKINGEE